MPSTDIDSMNALAKGIEQARIAVNRSAAGQVLPDLCDIVAIGLVSDGHSGQTEGEINPPVATNVPVEVSQASPGTSQVVAGDQSWVATHRLKFGYNSTTAAISKKQIVQVHARGNQPPMRFEVGPPEKGSTSVWLFVPARLTTGFRSPANV
jgi:hypothetical protein